MARLQVVLAATLLVFLAAMPTASAEHRVALVIGNDRYSNLPPSEQLQNAVSDARAVRASLETLGFEVLSGENVSRADLVERLSAFGARLQGGDIGFFFYAGHGVALSGANYILPSDIPAPRSSGREEEARLADNAVSEARIIERVTNTGAKVVVIALDACRNNPLAAPGGRSLGGSRGLSRIPETEGLMSIYSAGVGQVAYDRLNDADHNPNSVFTRVFAEVLKTPGLDLRGVAVETRRRVAELARGAGLVQSPGYYEQIDGDVYLAGPKVSPPSAPAPALSAEGVEIHQQALSPPAVSPPLAPEPIAAVPRSAPVTSAPPAATPASEQADFATAMQGGTRAAFEAFLSAHPAGPLADVIRRERDRIALAVAPPPAGPPPAPSPQPPRAAPAPQQFFGDELANYGVPPQSRLQRRVASATPLEIPGATRVTTRDVQSAIGTGMLMIDVLKGTPHTTLPTAIWLPGAGDPGTFTDAIQRKLGSVLAAATKGSLDTKLTFFCQGSQCWESYNAALRAVRLGYRQVYWYRGGLTAWRAAAAAMGAPVMTVAMP